MIERQLFSRLKSPLYERLFAGCNIRFLNIFLLSDSQVYAYFKKEDMYSSFGIHLLVNTKIDFHNKNNTFTRYPSFILQDNFSFEYPDQAY